jgi:hypothetical protein
MSQGANSRRVPERLLSDSRAAAHGQVAGKNRSVADLGIYDVERILVKLRARFPQPGIVPPEATQ